MNVEVRFEFRDTSLDSTDWLFVQYALQPVRARLPVRTAVGDEHSNRIFVFDQVR